MTQEEKARAYDEALEDMRVIYPNLKGDAKLAVEHAFPELAESEDERIRRTLVEYFGPEVQLDFVRGVPIQKIRDWLEKQKEQNLIMAKSPQLKEQKPLHWRRIEDATTQRTDDGCCVTSEKMLVKGWINDEDYRIVGEGTMVNRDILCIPVRELNAEQEEQKPEWKELEKWNDVGPTVEEYLGGIKPAEYIKRNSKEWYSLLAEQYDKGFWKGKAEQKPAEWSEEDEDMRDKIISDLEWERRNTTVDKDIRLYDEELHWLKSLKPQSHSEWRHYIWAINMRFDYTALIKYDNTDNYEIVQAGNRPKQEKNGVYILIKDIKPQSHWKPSEEQMKALHRCIYYLHGEGSGYFEPIKSLYEQLKKL